VTACAGRRRNVRAGGLCGDALRHVGVAWLFLAARAAARAGAGRRRACSGRRPLASDSAAATDGRGRRQLFSYREIALRADARGQYAADALINGLTVRTLIDTGASDIVISASTAARLGLAPSSGSVRIIQKANGKSTASPAVLRNVSFGGLYMNDVDALILAPQAGDVNLLGESFLKRLVSVEQRDGMLILRQ
jgi:clan AA aspartic protease (TIGR02281 family)